MRIRRRDMVNSSGQMVESTEVIGKMGSSMGKEFLWIKRDLNMGNMNGMKVSVLKFG